jgi:hypothetical protein
VSDPTEIPAPSTSQAMAPSMAQRYGTDRPRRRWVGITLGGLLAAALFAWAVWAASSHGNEPIEAQITSYQVVDAHEIQVRVAAQFKDADVDGSCLVRATAEDHTIVGELNLTADELRAAKGKWLPIRTERRATTATLVRCTD